ncbi:hypothetical protein QFZ79_000028 [Arthrobacter sp. V4I6]|nr:hypothetical protein [Arthrobacter sp. V4I6]
MQSSHATAPVAHRKSGPRRCLPTDGPRPHRPGTIPAPHRTPGPWGADRTRKQQTENRTMKEHSPDPYEVLHLRPAATARDVTRAYRSLVRTHHPDTRAPETVDAGPESSAQELHDIMDAYAVLGDPVRRAAYDRQRRGSPPPEPAPSPPPHEPSRAGPPSRSGPALIIGPVRLENPGQQATGQPGQRTADYRPMGSVRPAAAPWSAG